MANEPSKITENNTQNEREELGTADVNSQGEAELIVTKTLNPGTYQLYGTYTQTDNYESSLGEAELEILRKTTNTSVVPENTTITVGSNITLTITVSDVYQNEISSGYVTIYDNNDVIQNNYTITGNETIITFTPSATGTHEIYAVFSDNTGVYNSSVSDTVSISVEKITTNITLGNNGILNAFIGDNTTSLSNYSVVLKDSCNNPLSTQSLKLISYDNVELETAVTSASGIASFNYVPSSWSDDGRELAVTYDGTNIYQSCTSSMTVNLEAVNFNITLPSETYYVLDEMNITVALTDYSGNPITTGTLTLYDSEGTNVVTSVNVTSQNTIIPYTPPLDDDTTNTMVLKYTANGYVNYCSNTFNISPTKRPVTFSFVETPSIYQGKPIDILFNVYDSVTNEIVTTGKGVCKLNGQTIKDDDGKVLYIYYNQECDCFVLNSSTTVTSIQDYPIQIVYSGDKVYSAVRSEDVTVTVKSVPNVTAIGITDCIGDETTIALNGNITSTDISNGMLFTDYYNTWLLDENPIILTTTYDDGSIVNNVLISDNFSYTDSNNNVIDLDTFIGYVNGYENDTLTIDQIPLPSGITSFPTGSSFEFLSKYTFDYYDGKITFDGGNGVSEAGSLTITEITFKWLGYNLETTYPQETVEQTEMLYNGCSLLTNTLYTTSNQTYELEFADGQILSILELIPTTNSVCFFISSEYYDTLMNIDYSNALKLNDVYLKGISTNGDHIYPYVELVSDDEADVEYTFIYVGLTNDLEDVVNNDTTFELKLEDTVITQLLKEELIG